MGRPCTLDPQPNYSYCTDPDDSKQLTDGIYTNSHFWTQKTTVGWNHLPMGQVTIDLGAVQPVRGISFNTAAGVAGVSWPTAIHILASDEGKTWFEAGELVALSAAHGLPPPEGYRIHRYWTDQLATHGRFIRVIAVGSPYLFVDEIEVYRGEEALRAKPFAGPPITDSKEFFRTRQVRTAIIRRIASDAQDLRQAMGNSTSHENELTAITAAASQLPDVAPDSFRAVLPLNELHARLFRVQAAYWREQGCPSLTTWQSPLWDPLAAVAQPPKAPPPARIEMALMPGEFRAAAFNLSNAGEKDLRLKLRLEGLPPGCVTVHEVAWTDTKSGTPVAAALPEAQRDGDDFLIHVSSGLTRQVWLTFHVTTAVPGFHEGRIAIHGDGAPSLQVPIRLRVSTVRFPERPRLSLGGFDYTDADTYSGMRLTNRDALIQHLQSHFVDTPWGSAAVMPHPVRFERLDAWLDRWPSARHYRVFNSVGRTFAGHAMGTPEFDKAVGAWVSAYVRHLRERGILPGRLGLLLVDEPHEAKQTEVILAWAKAVKAAEPEVRIWEDPTFKKPEEANEMYPVCDVLCPNRPMWLEGGPAFQQVFIGQRNVGKTLNFYSCSGPVRSLDPYAYHRLQAWTCWQQGATAMFYWAFGDNGAGSDWNEAGSPGTSFSPAFLAPDGVTPAKHMEAIREGVEDYEYLAMLTDRIGGLERAGTGGEKLASAKTALAKAIDAVLNAPGVDKLHWSEPKDRGLAERVRLEILAALESLQDN